MLKINRKSLVLNNICENYFSPFSQKKLNFNYKLRKIIKFCVYSFLSFKGFYFSSQCPQEPKCILIASGCNLGGAIISIPLIMGIKKKWPNSHIAILTNRQSCIEVFKHQNIGDSYFCVPDISLLRMILGSRKAKLFREKIKKLSPDLFISNFDFQMSYLIPLKKISFSFSSLLPSQIHFESKLFDDYIVHDITRVNWLYGYWEILKYFSINYEDYPKLKANYLLGIKALKERYKNEQFSKKKLIAIQANVDASQEYKAWPDEKMAELCNKLSEDKKNLICIFGTKGQNSLNEYITKKYPEMKFINFVGALKISELIDVISIFDIVISYDSGLMHVASSLDIKTISLYGCTDPFITWVYPLDKKHIILRALNKKTCTDLYGLFKNHLDLNKTCVNYLSVKEVLSSTNILLNRN